MSQLFTLLVNIIVVAMMIGSSLESANRRSGIKQDENLSGIDTNKNVSPRKRFTSFKNSPSLFFLHLLKYKPHYQKLEQISTTTPRPPPPRDCICVPFYLCDANRTVITDGSGIIDFRIRQCTGDLEVCCYLRNDTRPPPTVIPTPPPITLPPTVVPTVSPSPPTTGPPNLNCICVDRSLCDPNGIVTFYGEGVINPRQNVMCPGANQVCCRMLIITTQPPTSLPTTMSSTMTLAPTLPPITIPPGQIQFCFVCNDTIRCVTCGAVIVPDGSGMIDPRFSQILSERSLCSARDLLPCQDITVTQGSDLLGPLKNPNTPQACYCVKTWLCSEGNVVSPDGLGVIDPRFTLCSSADQVCCRPMGIDLQALRNVDSAPRDGTVRPTSEPLDRSSAQITCDVRNDIYAPAQPFLTDSGRTYFAEFPWMVALFTKSTDSGSYAFQCGASMISNGAVLTAAHCVTNRKSEDLVARFGQWRIENTIQPLPTQEARISTIVTHPSYYSGGLFHDVAVLILEQALVYDVNVLPICLPEQGMVFAAGIRCYGIGWGSNSFGSEKYQAELRKVELPIVDRADCQTRLRTTKLGESFQLHGSFICAGGEANRDTCRGDGGGPLICQTSTGGFLQAGIVSWGIGCGTSNVPAVYTSVSQHRQWIDQQLATYGA